MSEKSRYKWLIRPLIHRNAIASLDWIGKSAPVPPLIYINRGFTSVQMCHTHMYIHIYSFINLCYKLYIKERLETSATSPGRPGTGLPAWSQLPAIAERPIQPICSLDPGGSQVVDGFGGSNMLKPPHFPMVFESFLVPNVWSQI
jgi:hypothetical protein